MIWNYVVGDDWTCKAAFYIGATAVGTTTALFVAGVAAAPVVGVGATVGVASEVYQKWNCS